MPQRGERVVSDVSQVWALSSDSLNCRGYCFGHRRLIDVIGAFRLVMYAVRVCGHWSVACVWTLVCGVFDVWDVSG